MEKEEFYAHARRSKRKVTNILGAVGAIGLIGAGLAIRNIRTDYTKQYLYEEGSLISSSTPKFRDIGEGDSEKFSVRGANYLTDKGKKVSPTVLYETIAVKVLKDKELVANIIKGIPTKKDNPKGNRKFTESFKTIPNNNTGLPDYIVINLQLLPYEDTYYSVVFYYRIRNSTIEAIKHLDLHPSLNLLLL